MADLAKLLRWPETRVGKRAVYAILAFFACMIVFYGLVASGQRGGETFLSNPFLAVPILLASVCGFASGLLSFWSLVFAKDRKLVLVMTLLVGAFVLYFTIGELLGHG